MVKRYGLPLILALLCVSFASAGANAKWVANGVPVCGLYYDENIQKVIPDGEHGAIVIWQDYRNGMGADIYGNKIEADGHIEPCGLPVCVAEGSQYQTQAIPDGAGGAIMVWTDYRSITGYGDLYAQRIDGTGTARWTENGMPICTADSEQNGSRIVPDGAGGVIIVWSDYREGQYDIYAQRVTADGDTLWQANGMPVDTSQGDQQDLQMVSDGSGGAIMIWMDTRNGDWDIYGQRLSVDGSLPWGTDAIPICLASVGLSAMRLVATPGGGAIAVWNDSRNGYWDAYAQKIDQDGSALWLSDGVTVCSYFSNKYSPQAAADGSGGVIVVWNDDRSGDGPAIAQRIDADGNPAWSPDGVTVFPAYGANEPAIMADGSGGAFVGLDVYSQEKGDYNIYVKKLDHDGNLLWSPEGSAACTAPYNQYYPQLCSDEHGGLIVAWADFRSGEGYSHIYCQRIGPSGLWGNPEPEIVSCLDVPVDQGGWVRIKTRASSHDVAGEFDSPIMGYNVWRMIAGGGGPLAASAVAAWAPAGDRARLLALLGDPATAKGVRVSGPEAVSLDLPPGDWESVGFWFATRDTVYNVAVPTKDDSTAAGTAEETFVVTAHASTAGVFVASEPAVGYSVDNLAPGLTPGFAGNEVASPAGLNLTWEASPASDLLQYDIHRGGDELFGPDASNLLGSTDGTGYHDGTWAKAYHYFYKLMAVDRHGNMGPAALLRPEDVKVGTMLQSFAASLSGSAVEISWTLSEAGADARFVVLRSAAASGVFEELESPQIARSGLSFSLADREVEPGTTYRYRVVVADESASRTLFETQGISTPAMPLTLHQNHPNPFNPSTTISYYLPEASVVTLDVYDSSGRLISRLYNGAKQDKGTHEAGWRGMDAQGRAVSSGMYFYRLTSGKVTISKKMVLLR